MALSSEDQALFDHAKQSLPRWLTSGVGAALEWLYGFVAEFSPVRTQGQAWVDITYISNATGVELDQHARDRGTSRRSGESDAALQTRLQQIDDAVTQPALMAGVNAILAAAGYGTCAFVNLRRDRAHCHTVGSSTAFVGRGYRVTRNGRPMAYIVILPYPTNAATGNAVAEYLRQFGPAGFIAYVERRINP